MTLSILICVHSRDELHDTLLGSALRSLVDQTRKDFDVVVVLNDCHAATERVVDDYRKYLDIKCLIKPDKTGLASAKNFGLREITSDYIMFLDADDAYHFEKVERQMTYMETHPEVDFCFTQAWDIHPNGRITENCFKLGQYKTHEQIAARLPIENVLCHGSACIKRKCLEYLGGYPENRLWLGQEDYVLWKMAVSVGFKFYNMPERLYYYSLGTSVAR